MNRDCIWRDEPCGERGINHGLCSRHYSAARHRGLLDSYDVNVLRGAKCAHCDIPIPPGRRAGSKFCSVECKEAARAAEARAANLAAKVAKALRCAWCKVPLDVKRKSRKFCSDKCRDDHHNAARAILTEKVVKAVRRPCEFCGEPIPRERRADAVYCSMRCKNASGSVPTPERRAWNRAYMLKYQHGITVADYDCMLAEQGGGCAICGTTEPGGRRDRFHVDHDHAVGVNRGLLCAECNIGLGKLGDDPGRLRAAADYLDYWDAVGLAAERAPATKTERAVWDAWSALPEDCLSPVGTIAEQLGMERADVAFIVYPAEKFGAWSDDQEPMEPWAGTA